MTENDDNNNLSDKEKNIYNRILTENGIKNNKIFKKIGEETVVKNEKAIKKKHTTWVTYLCCCQKRNVVAAGSSSIDMGNRHVTPVIPLTPPISKKKTLELEDNASIQRSIIANQSSANALTTPPAAVFLPNIHVNSHYDQNNDYKSATSQRPPLQSRFSEIDEIKLQDTMSQLSGLLTTSKALSKSLPLTNRVGDSQPSFHNGKTQSIESEIVTPIRSGNISKRSDDFGSSMTIAGTQQNNKLFYRGFKKANPNSNSVASAPAAIISDGRDPAPSTSSSNSTDVGLNGGEMKTNRLNMSSGALEISNSMSYRNINNNFDQKVKAKRAALAKNLNNKVACNGNPFPDNLKPFDRPKEGLDTCFNQLESQQWEVNMQGLTSLVRLLRHHPAIVLSQLHPIVEALGRQIRNLRSQVSRAACQASGEMFVTLKRNLETDLDELAGHLFHRSADTNRFIRADCNHALDNMTDNISPGRVVSVIIAKGASHQNATVRTVSARLLLRLSEKVGPERVLTLPKDIRDKMLQVGANLLMEGKLETRAFAKELFRVWSSQPGFSALLLEAIPPNVMRHISKTLISLKS